LEQPEGVLARRLAGQGHEKFIGEDYAFWDDGTARDLDADNPVDKQDAAGPEADPGSLE